MKMNVSKELQIYIIRQRTLCFRVSTRVEDHWKTRILEQNIHTLGEEGVQVYMKRWGKGIGEKKVVMLAVKAEREGASDFAQGLWTHAYSIHQQPSDKTRKINQSRTIVRNKDPIQKIKILFITASPDDSERIALEREIRDIDLAIQQGRQRDRFVIEKCFSVRATDLRELLFRHEPHIVHFSGHGTTSGDLVLESRTGDQHTLTSDIISTLFKLTKRNIKCVVLNACHSYTTAQKIAEHIDFVIGMSGSIGDNSSREFSVAFYHSLAHGESVQKAYDLARLQVNMHSSLYHPVPTLIALRDNPNETKFV